MATIPIHNPAVPFLGQIPGGLRAGFTVKIRGAMNDYGSRVNFNLQVGPALSPRDDVTLQLSIRPDHQCIVRNSFENQSYGTEERFGGCPIQYNQSFELSILADYAGYKISINGNYFCQFNHRLSMSRVQFISVGEGCKIHYIGHEGPGVPAGPPVYQPSAPIYPPSLSYPNVHKPHTPHYPPAGGIQVLPHAPPAPPPPPPYTPTPPYPIHHPNQHATPYGCLSSTPPQPVATTNSDAQITSTIHSNIALPNYSKQSNLYPPINLAYDQQKPSITPMNQAFVSPISHSAAYRPPHKHATIIGAYDATAAAKANAKYWKNKKNKKALKIAAGVGAGLGVLGLGGFAVSRAIKKAGESGGSSSDTE